MPVSAKDVGYDFDKWSDAMLSDPNYAGYTKPELKGIWDKHYGLPSAEAPKKEPGVMSDAGNLVGIGMDQMAQSARWATGKVFGEGAVQAIDRLGGTSGEKMEAATKSKVAALSTPMQQAIGKEWVSQDQGGNYSAGPALTDWRSYVGAIAQSLPGTIATMGPAGFIAKSVGAAAKARALQSAISSGVEKTVAEKLATEAASKAAERAAWAAGSVLEGAQGGAQAGKEVEDEIMKLDLATLRQSQAFMNLVSGGMSEQDARKALASDRSVRAAVTAGLVTGAFGGVGDKFVARAFGKGVEGKVLARMGKGALSEGSEEFGQGLFGKMAQNEAIQGANPNQSLMQGALNEAVGGVAAGAPMGAGFGVVSRQASPASEKDLAALQAEADGQRKAAAILQADQASAQDAQAKVQGIMAANTVGEMVAAATGASLPAYQRAGVSVPGAAEQVSSIAQPLGGDVEVPAFARAGLTIPGIEPLTKEGRPVPQEQAQAPVQAPAEGSANARAGQAFLARLGSLSPKAAESIVASAAKLTGARDMAGLGEAIAARFGDRQFWGQLISNAGTESRTVATAALQTMQSLAKTNPELQAAAMHIKDAATQAGDPAAPFNQRRSALQAQRDSGQLSAREYADGMATIAADEERQRGTPRGAPKGSIGDVTFDTQEAAQGAAGAIGATGRQAVETTTGTKLELADSVGDEAAVAQLRSAIGSGADATSKAAVASGAVASIRAVPDTSLPGIALARAVMRKLGRRVVVFDSDGGIGNINGANLPGLKNVLFIHAKTKRPALAVVGHELLHSLSPELRAKLAKSLMPMIGESKIAEKVKMGLSREAAIEEVMADLVGNRFTEASFWRFLEKKNPSLFRDFAQRAMQVLDRIMAAMKQGLGMFGADEGLSSKQLMRARVTIANILTEHAQSLAPEEQKRLGWNGQGSFASNNQPIPVGQDGRGRVRSSEPAGDERPATKVGRVEPTLRAPVPAKAAPEQPKRIGYNGQGSYTASGQAIPVGEDGRAMVAQDGTGDEGPARVVGRANIEVTETNHDATEAQRRAGNYLKGVVIDKDTGKAGFEGLDIKVENHAGSTREGKAKNGRKWSVGMSAHYGYVRGTTGADGDQVDVYLVPEPMAGAPVFVFDQYDGAKFDEHKVVLGVTTRAQAESVYDAHFSDGSGPKRRKGMRQMSMAEFKAWLDGGKTKEPVAAKDGAFYSRENQDDQASTDKPGDGDGRQEGRGLAPLAGAPAIQGATGPDPRLVSVAQAYARKAGIKLTRQAEYVKVDPERAARIADAYAEMRHAPNDPKVRAAYADMIEQTKAQYRALEDAGYEFTFFDSKTDPYGGNPWNAMRDLRANKRMAVYGTYDGYGTEGITTAAIEDNPMLADTGMRWPDQDGVKHPVLANDLFRAVHDAFGHGLEGAGFRAEGEENAWQAHVRMFTGPAVGAITSETRGQNSWLNFGPYGEKNRSAKLEDTVFADQKTGLMPEWTWTDGVVSDEPSYSAEQASSDDFTPEKVGGILKKDGWAILTSENPGSRQASDRENAELYSRLLRKLRDDGIEHIEAKGMYDRKERSVVVLGVTEKQASDIGKEFDQESVLTRKGLVYQDGSLTPATGVTTYDTEPDNYYTVVNDAIFGVDLDFDQRLQPDEATKYSAETGDLFYDDIAPRRASMNMNWIIQNPVEARRLLKLPAAKGRHAITKRLFGEAVDKFRAGKIDPKDHSRSAINKLSKALADEAEWYSKHAEDAGLDWYSTKYQAALDKLAEKVPSLKDESNRFLMSAILAITSDGTEVQENLNNAMEIYLAHESGKSLVESSPGGKYKNVFAKNLGLLDAMIEDMGQQAALEMLLEETTAAEARAEMKALGIKNPSTDYPPDARLPRAAVWFGPKLGAFFANLSGRGEYLTMDRWWNRTINRYRGHMTSEPTASSVATFREQADQPDMPLDQLIELAEKIADERQAKYEEARKNDKFYEPSPLELAAKNLYQQAEVEINDAPQGSSDRRFQIAVAKRAVQLLAERGLHTDVAGVQATIWFYEKELFKSIGVFVKNRISYEEAANTWVQAGRAGGRKRSAAQTGGANVARTNARMGQAGLFAEEGPDAVAPKYSSEFDDFDEDEYGDVEDPFDLKEQAGHSLARDTVTPTKADQYAARRWLAMAEDKSLFAHAISEDSELENIAYDIGKYRVTPWRPANRIEKVDGATKAAEIKLPDKTTATVLKDNKGNVWGNLVMMNRGSQHGSAIYSIIANYAHNNDLKFIGDPAGLSDDAVFRRTENMLASALKFGTTKHIRPHEIQESAGLDWRYGDTEYNVAAMLAWSRSVVMEAVPILNELSYNPKTGAFSDPEGNKLTRAELTKLLLENGGQEARAGAKTAARTVATNEFIAEYERGAREAKGGVPKAMQGVSYSSDESAPEYGKQRLGAASDVGVHFSKAPRKTLDANRYGSGLKGLERERLDGRENDDIRPRIFFYVDKGRGVNPEAGVGGYAHRVRLNNLYDATKDPLKLVKNNPGANNWERAIMRAGFDGYLSMDPVMPQGFAVLIGKKHVDVPVQQFAPRGFSPAPAAAPETLKRGLLSSELKKVDVSAIPGAAVKFGDLVIPAGSAEQANAEMERIGSPVRFSSEQIDTPQFKRWFGDGAVVDGGGRPVVVYHGGPEGFGRSANTIVRAGKYRPFWVTPSKELGDAYARGGSSAALYVNIKRPANLTEMAEELLPIYNADKELLDDNPDAVWTEDDGDIKDSAYILANSRDVMDKLIADGYDSLTLEERPGVWSYGILDRSNVKSATDNNGDFDPANPDIRYSSEEPPFFSELQRNLEKIDAKAMPGAMWSDRIQGLINKGQAKADEVEWSGVRDWLALQQGKVTKDQVLGYLQQNGVRVEEVTLGEQMSGPELDAKLEQWAEANPGETSAFILRGASWDTTRRIASENGDEEVARLIDGRGQSSKYGQYQLPGGTNYREVLLTLPAKQFAWTVERMREKRGLFIDDMGFPPEVVDQAIQYAEEAGSVEDGLRMADARVGSGVYKKGTKEARDMLRGLVVGAQKKNDASRSQVYKSSHWDQPNVLAHIRLNDRTDADGNRVLFAEELQSDWAQAGRAQGFAVANSEKRIREITARMREIAKDEEAGKTGFQDEEWDRLSKEKSELAKPGIVRAPFVENTDKWLTLALKRIMVMAAQEGYDKVAFVNGEQSAERYDLSKQIDSIDAKSRQSSSGDFRYDIDVSTKEGKDFNRDGLSPQELEDHVGKEMAQKIIEATPTAGKRVRFSGLDLKVGGEGMRSFYDKIIPAAVNKLLAKTVGGRLETVSMEHDPNPELDKWEAEDGEGDGSKAPVEKYRQLGFTITPAMREKVGGGMPLFSAEPDWVANGPAALKSAAGKIDTYAPAVPLKTKVQQMMQGWSMKLQQGIADAYAPLRDLDKQAGTNTYLYARMAKAADGALEGTLTHGKPRMDSDGATYGDLDGKGFLGHMADLKGEHDRFMMWIAGNRSNRLAADGKENLFERAEIEAMMALDQGSLPDGSSRALLYESKLREFNAYNKAVLDIAEKTGLIDGASRDLWEHDFYVPFFRVGDDMTIAGPGKVKGLVRQEAFKRLKGGKENLGDLMENTIRNWQHLLQASLANQAAGKALQAAEAIGVAVSAPQGAAQDMAKSMGIKGGATFFMDGGKEHWYVVDDVPVMTAITALEAPGLKGLPMELMGKFKHLLTRGVTISPAFKVANLIRDTVAAPGVNQMSANLAANLVGGWSGTDKSSNDYAQMLFGGALMRFGQLTDGKHAEHAKRLIAKGVNPNTILDSPNKIKAAFENAVEWWDDFGDRMENVNRAALYKSLRAEGMSHLEASYKARDMMDFSMQGAWTGMRTLTQVVPFLNARVQGLYKMGRAAKEDPARLGYMVGAVAAASILLMLSQQDDDDWKRREDWDRDAFWWIKMGGVAYRIPKPFEIGAMGTIAERSLEWAISDEMGGKRFASRVGHMLLDTFAMNPIPQLFKPAIDIYANKDGFSGRDIETQGMERLSKPERSGPGTTAVAKALGQMGDVTGLSPVQIDYLAKAYFGWLGGASLATVDVMARPFGDDKAPADRWDKYTGGFVKDLPSAGSRYVTEFYDQAKAIRETMADIKLMRETGELARAKELETSEAFRVQMSRVYAAAERQVSEINKQIKQVRNSHTISPEEKAERIQALDDRKHALAKSISERARQRQSELQQ